MKLFETSVEGLNPVGAIYNLNNESLESFIQTYLEEGCGIDGIEGVRVRVERDGNTHPKASLFVFLNQNSNELTSSGGNINLPPALKKKMDMSNFRPSKKLGMALAPLTKKVNVKYTAKMAYVELNIFRALALMLKADARAHQLTIMEIVRTKNDTCIMTVVKSEKFIGGSSDTSDKLRRIANSL